MLVLADSTMAWDDSFAMALITTWPQARSWQGRDTIVASRHRETTRASAPCHDPALPTTLTTTLATTLVSAADILSLVRAAL